MATPKKHTDPGPDAELLEPKPVEDGVSIPHARLMASIVNEIARSRARFRALLDILEESGHIEIARFVDAYRQAEEKDFVPFVDLLLLSAPQFASKHESWLKQNKERFGYDGSSRTHVSIDDRPSHEDRRPPHAPAIPRKRLATTKPLDDVPKKHKKK